MRLFHLLFVLITANLICRCTDMFKYFRESPGPRDNKNRLYLFHISSSRSLFHFISAGFYPNTYAQPTVAPYNAGFHAAKGYATPMYTGNFYNNYAHPVNAQYWTGHSLPAGYQKYPQSYGYSQYGQPNYYGYQSWNYPQQYGYMGVHPAYSGQYLHYPNFNANYWTGHHQMYPIHGVPVYPQQYPYGHYGMQYPYYHGPFYPRPRGFLDGIARSKVAKGLLGALVVGVVAKKIARGK